MKRLDHVLDSGPAPLFTLLSYCTSMLVEKIPKAVGKRTMIKSGGKIRVGPSVGPSSNPTDTWGGGSRKQVVRSWCELRLKAVIAPLQFACGGLSFLPLARHTVPAVDYHTTFHPAARSKFLP